MKLQLKRVMKKSTKQYIIVAILCILVIGGVAGVVTFVITSQVKNKYNEAISTVFSEMEQNKKTVYVATSDIMAGDSISNENVQMQTIYATQPIETYITSEDIGKIAIIDIVTGTQITKSMLSEESVSSELREVEFDVININSNIVHNDTVDVRINYPNGESYVVLSKKIIKGVMPDSPNCFFWLNEEEIHRMSAAIVDAGLYSGSKLTTTKYIEPNIQEASLVTYTPSIAILSLLESDPNIVERCSQELNKEVRKALENRLAESMELDVSEINWDVNPNIKPIVNTETTEENSSEEPKIKEPKANKETITNNSNEISYEDNSVNTDLGSRPDYMYYTEEEEAKKGEIELGQ